MLSRPDRIAAVASAAFLLAAGGGGALADYRHDKHELRAKAEALTGGDAARGEALFQAYGCGGCHALQGVPQAQGQVGPPLDGIATRAIIAGRLQNKPDNLMRWIADPQAVWPGTAMPDLCVGKRDSRDIAAFLYTRI